MNHLRRWSLLGASLFTLVGCDHATKYAAKAQLENQPPRQMIKAMLDLRYVENTDVAFNLFRSVPANLRGPMLLLLGAVAIMALLVALQRWRGPTLARIALVFISAGALGNYLDRLLRGYVVDFIHVPHWPVFNVADVWVTVGVALLCWANLRSRHDPRPV